MAFIFTYEFKSGGSMYQMWKSCKDFREHGKVGIGATAYAEPIPYGMYFQTSRIDDPYHIGHPQVSIGQFGPVAYGFKMINAFTYAGDGGANLYSELFEGMGDQTRRALFNTVAENNRQIKLMGESLIRLSSTGVYDYNGESSQIPDWNSSSIPNITGISASDDVVIGKFEPLHEAFDGPSYSNQTYFMLLNAKAGPDGTTWDSRQTITLTIGGGITALESIDLTTGPGAGTVETIPVTGGTVDILLEGGRGKLFKFQTGAPFVGFYDGE